MDKIAKKMRSMVLSIVILGAMLTVVSHDSLVMAQSASIWSVVTIPDLPTGASLVSLWTDRPGNLYVWSYTNEPRAILYHWDGRSWSQKLNLLGHSAAYVFGTGPSDIFASACVPAESYRTRMYHYDGTAWTEQLLPAGSKSASNIVGEPGNVYTGMSHGSADPTFILRYDGNEWQIVYTSVDIRHLAYISRNEIYSQSCWGHYLWDGNSWTWFPGFDFCDANVIWGMRDGMGILHLYTAGNNNFSNGVRVWRFVENPPGSMRGSWGCKCCTVFSDPGPGCSGYSGAGSANGIWGSGPNDIYVTGNLNHNNVGRVYHFDGTSWQRITDFGDIPQATSVWGSGPDDVWVGLADGLLLHYGPPVINVTIDIKPGSFPNPINLKSKGNVPVAILSSTTFDATTVDRSTVEFAGAHPLPIGETPEDVNGDGLLDIVLHFKTQDLNLQPGETEACLTGKTFNEQEFRGCDSVRILYCKGPILGDLDENCKVNFADFVIFCSHWLECTECTDPNCG